MSPGDKRAKRKEIKKVGKIDHVQAVSMILIKLESCGVFFCRHWQDPNMFNLQDESYGEEGRD